MSRAHARTRCVYNLAVVSVNKQQSGWSLRHQTQYYNHSFWRGKPLCVQKCGNDDRASLQTLGRRHLDVGAVCGPADTNGQTFLHDDVWLLFCNTLPRLPYILSDANTVSVYKKRLAGEVTTAPDVIACHTQVNR